MHVGPGYGSPGELVSGMAHGKNGSWHPAPQPQQTPEPLGGSCFQGPGRVRRQSSSNWEEQGLRPPPVLGDTEPRNAEPRASTEGRRGPRSIGM